jgi:protein-S-isoprenylcysteine O-methyltransferase Ste14
LDLLALSLWIVYFAVSLGLRVALQRRRTGSTGFLLMRARPGSVQWLGETLEALAIGLGVAAAVLADSVEPLSALDGTGADALGVAVFAAGLAGVFVSQEAMAGSWRIGQDASDRTELVTRGPFGVVRNPIFSALVLVQAGIALVVPSVLALAGLALLVLSIELQVRLVEEPHLRRLHGNRYTEYAGRVGRFVPLIGRWRREPTRATTTEPAGPTD